MSSNSVLVITRGVQVMHLALNRPNAANALNRELHEALITALDVAAGDGAISAVVLTSNGGRVFSAGADLKELAVDMSNPKSSAVAAQQGSDRLLRTLLTLIDFPKPLICALQGKAVGAGAMLALAADEIHAGAGASFRFPEITLDMPSPMSVAMLQGRTTRPMVHRLVQQGASISADEALLAGLVDGIVPDAQLLDHADLRAAGLATGRAYAANKRWINLDLRRRLVDAANESKRLRQAQNIDRNPSHAT
jgi:enoyl-CoA hydratase/carnithine racemase